MKSNWKFIIPLVLFGGVLVVFYASLDRDKATLPSALIDKPAPLFSLPSMEDPAVKVSNSDLAGKPYAVNVWGTWCPGCLREHAALMQIAKRNDVPLIGINWKDDTAQALLYLKRKGNPFAFNAVDADGRTAIDWGVYGAPETFLVSAQGKVIYKHVGEITVEIWKKNFVPLLGPKTRDSE
jgi:cytochrome c biogenesis protein CcmG/thiol:disulfide interchange protein DsbE